MKHPDITRAALPLLLGEGRGEGAQLARDLEQIIAGNVAEIVGGVMMAANVMRKTKLKDVCERITVGHVGPMAEKYTADGVPFLRSQNITAFRLHLDDIKFIPLDFHEKLRKSALHPGDVAVVRTGYPGTACVIPDRFSELNCADLVVITPSKELNPYFLAALFNSVWGMATVSGNLVGVAQQHFNIGAAREMEVALPSRPVQDRIAGILSAYDGLMENSQRRIRILEAMARALYREWFVHFRFPGHEKLPRVASPLGDIPKGWEVKPIQHFGQVITGKTPSKANADFYGDEVPFVKTPDMHGNMFILGTSDRLSTVGAESQANKTLPAGSICVSCIGTIGVISITTEDCQTNQQINSVVLENEASREFLFLRLQDAKQTLENLGANGATMGNVNKGKFEAMAIVSPSAGLLAEYHRLAQPMFSAILMLSRQIQHLRRTRDLLLPRLLSGQVNLEAN